MTQAMSPCLRNTKTGDLHELAGRITTIGSASDCKIRLPGTDPAHVAHCLFSSGNYIFQVLTEDISVKVNKASVDGRRELKNGDLLHIGSLEFEFVSSGPKESTTEADHIGELLDMILLLLRNRDQDISSTLLTAIARLLRCDAARIVGEEQDTGRRYTLIRYPAHAGLDRFSNRAIDWAKEASRTVLMLEPDWARSSGDNRSLEKNAVSSILCAPLHHDDVCRGYLYLDRIRKDDSFDDQDRSLCDRLLPVVMEILINSEERQRQTELIATLQKSSEDDKGGIIYRSESMHNVISLADRIAPTDSPVLITGETGTGKELMARRIHSKSLRSEKPFKAVNCGALPENLIESELFGHEKGSFTGATSRKQGLFEAADGGTIFLDEVGEMPLPVQVKLLRVLQESEITPVGGTETRKVDVRIIAATNRDPEKEVEEGRFRPDLYFRLNVLLLHIPSLRERSEDILLLAEYFVAKYCGRMGRDQKIISSGGQQKLAAHLWPGNVRELENVIQRAVVLSASKKIEAKEINLPAVKTDPTDKNPQRFPTIRSAREAAEKEVIRNALRATNGNVSQTSRLIEIDRKWLITKMSEYGIDAAGFRLQKES
ncbi:MAG: sigma 54-interacting transcriptional regulator [Chitinispirillaceae bacterium]